MKKNSFDMSTLALVPIALLVAACSSTGSDPVAIGAFPVDGTAMIAYVDGVPGGVLVDSSEVKATVAAIDKAQRTMTLMGADGNSFTAKVGPEAINFDQVETDDTVTVALTQTLAIYMGDADSASTDGDAVLATGAPVGGKPGMVVAGSSQMTATVKAIDEKNRTATLEFADGADETFPVREDVDLSERKIGEHVVFRLGTMVTIDVVKP
jgi:hypothetical protein